MKLNVTLCVECDEMLLSIIVVVVVGWCAWLKEKLRSFMLHVNERFCSIEKQIQGVRFHWKNSQDNCLIFSYGGWRAKRA